MLTRCERLCLGIVWLAVGGLVLVGCGGGGGSAAPPAGDGVIRGTVALPQGQSPADVVVRVEGTELQTRPGPDGRFEIRGVPTGVHTVSAVAAGSNLGASAAVRLDAAGVAFVVNLSLAPGGQIAGIITAFTADGGLQVRAGARITARPGDSLPVPMGYPSSVGSTGAEAPDPDIRLVATSDADGTFAIKGVTPGSYIVSAALDPFPPQERWVYIAVGSTAPADFTFGAPAEPRFGQVTGKVSSKSDGQPVPGAAVWADVPLIMAASGWADALPTAGTGAVGGVVAGGQGSAAPSIYPLPPIWEGVHAITDASGVYTLKLPVGHYAIRCQHRDFREAVAEVDVRADQSAALDFALDPLPGERPRLRLTAGVGKPQYAPGEPVALSLVLENIGNVPVAVSFDGSEASFSVFRGEGLIWMYGGGVPVPMPVPVMEPVRRRDVMTGTLAPGQTREYRTVWDQRRFDGGMVDPGEFLLRGGAHVAGIELQAGPVAFTIGP
ncbi:MAG: carboxypeptidase regulatory-like domain-containing protein [Armatimonadetes bacterium]|nr:carboxypeptidase regulatory-like domain-containing protein [Armatimonadota bacterium]